MDRLHDGDIGHCGEAQMFCVKRHLVGNQYECYWAVFINERVINTKCYYYVHYKAQKEHIDHLTKYLKSQGYNLIGNKICKDEF